jgi:ABC-type glycerol-3-phosphate transport system substrate-binding protein
MHRAPTIFAWWTAAGWRSSLPTTFWPTSPGWAIRSDDDIIPATTTICKVGDDVYLAPFFGNVTVLLYNKQLIADAGYQPEDITTFADVMDIAQKTHEAERSAFRPRRFRR